MQVRVTSEGTSVRVMVYALTLPFVVCALTSCQRIDPSTQAEVKWLRGEVEKLKASSKAMQDQLGDVQASQALESSRHQSAILDVAERGYARVDSEAGIFLVAVRGVRPHLNGHRVTLAIGNLTSGTYSGFNLSASWGKSVGPGVSYTDALASRKHRQFAFVESLRPGSWVNVALDLVPSAPDELGYFDVSITTNQVLLTQH